MRAAIVHALEQQVDRQAIAHRSTMGLKPPRAMRPIAARGLQGSWLAARSALRPAPLVAFSDELGAWATVDQRWPIVAGRQSRSSANCAAPVLSDERHTIADEAASTSSPHRGPRPHSAHPIEAQIGLQFVARSARSEPSSRFAWARAESFRPLGEHYCRLARTASSVSEVRSHERIQSALRSRQAASTVSSYRSSQPVGPFRPVSFPSRAHRSSPAYPPRARCRAVGFLPSHTSQESPQAPDQ